MGSCNQPSRREFLKAAGAALAVPYVITSTALGDDETPPASDRIVMGGATLPNDKPAPIELDGFRNPSVGIAQD